MAPIGMTDVIYLIIHMKHVPNTKCEIKYRLQLEKKNHIVYNLCKSMTGNFTTVKYKIGENIFNE